ncbi:CheY chemotaxis protein or a CheY-like REC (receiver) domain [Dyadobacter koreensis]|uniref:CheY chemotaxis protein or a CheY-like REC (Receiver) domain n=1 Tax=Dyadobacter koreensis TaxID=408657 RepID=A0A1H6TRN3_9BACT|nr:response regulator [Dyadobacter koreensis]SEI82719.1 CheY chemotaxis protein or a CheY-like REC (receiver) domain [Dyadobacter koreensis]
MGTKKTIYLVDDDEDDLLLLRQALESVIPGVSIIEIRDGKTLLDMVEKQEEKLNPSLILIDLNMQRMGGIEAVSNLKANPKTHNIPVVMVSTSNDEQVIRGAYEEGVSAFITKPLSHAEYKKIAEAINVCFLNSFSGHDDVLIPDNFKDKSILVVECDDEKWKTMNHGFKSYLHDLNIIRTCNRLDTLNFLTEEWFNLPKPPELIIFDIYLPTRQEGLGLLDSIRYFFLFHSLPAIPIIIFSTSDQTEDIKACYEHNANAYLTKSQDINESMSYFKKLCHFWCSMISVPKSM